ncbi:MAG: hypothetical protein WA584_13380 [Pyrinomonadaceae bacterium]
MLDTLLQIGKILRKEERLQHHRYIKSAPQIERTKTGIIKMDVVYLNLPVREDFSFDFDNLEMNFHNENIIDEFYYLKYKTSDADSSVKYLWGDIFYSIDKDGKEQGSYRIDATKNAFLRTAKDEEFFVGTAINKFRQSFTNNKDLIEQILSENAKGKQCYLHFDFIGRKERHWYQFKEEFKILNEKMLEEFLEKQNGQIVLRKYLYKTLASPKKDLKFPNFHKENIYKTRVFNSIEEVLDLFYSIDYSLQDIIRIDKIKINVLPKGENLSAKNIEEYFDSKGLARHTAAVGIISDNNQPDDFFLPFTSDVSKNFIQFDVIFSKASGGSSPDVDVIELANLERDLLVELSERILDIRLNIEAEREKIFGKNDKIKPLSIKKSFLNILGDVTKDKKKYQSHLLRVLPQIYSGNYYRDDVLLSAFIEKTEFNIRNDKGSPFNFLKFDYEFLVKLRNEYGDEEMKNMFESPSYEAGMLLGQMAQPVSRKINSFKKTYVGQLSRRVTDVDNLMDFAGFICEKLEMHDKAFPNLKEDFGKFMSKITVEPHNYDRRYFVVGFFEGFFKNFETPENKGENND